RGQVRLLGRGPRSVRRRHAAGAHRSRHACLLWSGVRRRRRPGAPPSRGQRMTTCEAIAVDLLPPDEARTAAARRRARRLGGLGVAIAALGLALGHGALEVAGGVTEQEIVQADAERAALE